MKLSNLLTLRKFFNWRSTWCSKFFYRSLLYKDLFIQFYINSIFHKLKLNSSSIKLNYLSTNLVICTVDIYINSLFRLKKYNELFFLKAATIYEYSLYYITNSIFSSINKDCKNLHYLFLTYLYKLIPKLNLSDYTNIMLLECIDVEYLQIIYIETTIISDLKFNKNYLDKPIDVNMCFKLECDYIEAEDKILHTVLNNINYNFSYYYFSMKDSKFEYDIFYDISKIYLIDSVKFIINIKNYILNYLNIFNMKLLNFLVNIIYFKVENFNIKFYNKNTKIYKFDTVKNTYLKLKKNSILNSLKSINYYTYNKLKLTFFYFLNYEPVTLLNYSLLKKIIYYKNKRIFKKLKKVFYNVIDKWASYKLDNKYLFILWFLQKIWFKVFNTHYIKYIYNFKDCKNYTITVKLVDFLLLLKKYIIYFNYFNIKKDNINMIQNLNTFIKLKKFIINLKSEELVLKKFFKYIYINAYMITLIYEIEKTLLFYNYKNINYLFIPNIFLFVRPFITSAKMVCDYLYFKLKKKLNINTAYNKIKKWQLAERSLVAVSFKIKRSRFYFKNNSNFEKQLLHNTFFRDSIDFRSPLKGIRCVCIGPPNKARRKARNFYHIWIANFSLTGWMPLQQLRYQIDYYQTFIILKKATIGLKVWVLLESYIILK